MMARTENYRREPADLGCERWKRKNKAEKVLSAIEPSRSKEQHYQDETA